jgi:hypothetical protein
MSWADIDFDFIKSNYITRGPAEVSFGDYLNQFAMAAKEKFNMLKTPAETLPDYEFGPNHTRDLGSSTSTFWSQYQEMITDYSRMWNNYTWYSEEVLTDTGNPSLYLLDDTDLTDIITVPTWDIIQNTGRSNKEAFTADVLNALYEIYKLTRFQGKSIEDQDSGSFNSGYPIGVPGAFNLNAVTRSRTDGSFYGLGNPAAREASAAIVNGTAHAEYLADHSANSLFFTATSQISTLFFGIVKIGIAPAPTQWTADYTGVTEAGFPSPGAQDGSTIYCYYQDLDGVDLEMDMSVQLQVSSNYKFYNFNTGGPTTTVQLGAYDAQWPNIGVGGGAHLDKANPQSITHGSAYGSKYIYAYNANGGATPWPQETVEGVIPGGLTDNFREQHSLDLKSTNSAFVDLNNIGLEFYIAP